MRHMIAGVVGVGLILTQGGCRSVYRFQCTAHPPGAVVLVGRKVVGQTDCTVKIPRRSHAIRDHRIEMVFSLPDDREKTHIVDLRGLKPSNPLAETVSAPFMLLGAGLLFLSGGGDEDDNADDDKDDHRMGLLGFGTLGVGAGLFHLLGGDADSLSGYPVRIDFHGPTEAVESEETGVQ